MKLSHLVRLSYDGLAIEVVSERCVTYFKNYYGSWLSKRRKLDFKRPWIQECIPIWCVPPTCHPYLPACTVPGGWGYLWSGGVPVYLVPGGYLPRYPPVDRMTDTWKKHNLRKLRLRAVITDVIQTSSSIIFSMNLLTAGWASSRRW